jgi:hypothetical protein
MLTYLVGPQPDALGPSIELQELAHISNAFIVELVVV